MTRAPFEPESLLAEHPILLTMPDRLTDVASWHQHIPFAFWAIAALRPGVVVELGTHKGDSYSAFCQAVQTLSLDTRCFAVDSWEGDQHTHAYSSEVLAELRQYHDRRYRRFSTLIQARFDEATRWFENGSIDLLHIDGTHTAEAVRRDYEQWLPKLSPKGVVLFHDIAVRRKDFGVHEVWADLAAHHPSLSFSHGNGLGVLAPGCLPPDAFLQLVALDAERRKRLGKLFHYLGRAVEGHGIRQRSALAKLSPAESATQTAITAERALIGNLYSQESEAELKRLNGRLAAAREARADLQRKILEQEIELRKRDDAFRLAWHALASGPFKADESQDATDAPPTASILIPVHNGWHHTVACLESIRATRGTATCEIIVVDDASTDGTYDILRRRTDIRLLRNPSNLGYLRSCNEAARHATGKYLVLLNNDTLVQPGWLDELIRTFEEVPEAGLVGARLIYPDGRLQEAGALVWQDGSGWNFGRGDDPDRPEYRYRRDADYCSAACAAIPLALWRALGGFDESYMPAYCEDTDLAFRLRAAGYRVLYQPLARVIHVEGASHGTDLTSGLKAHQLINQQRFRARWAATLATHGMPDTDLATARDRQARWRVLFVDDLTPRPDQDAGSVATMALLLSLQRMGYKVVFCPNRHMQRLPGYTEALERAGIECLASPYTASLQSHLEAFGSLYDLIFTVRATNVSSHLHDFRRFAPNAPIALLVADLHFLRLEREAALTGKPEDQTRAAEMRALELAAIARVDCTIVHSTAEQELLAEIAPHAATYCFPWVQDVVGTQVGFEARTGVMFIGGYGHPPNVDAVEFFVAEILPLLLEEIPDLVFYAVGSNPPPSVLALQSDHVVVTGHVPDPRPLLDQCRVSVAPLRYGAGIKGKVALAMSHGLPVVATPIAVEGTELVHDRQVLVGSDAAELAAQIIRAYTDQQLWHRLSRSGMEFVDRHYSRDQGDRHVEAILARAGAPRPDTTAARVPTQVA